MTWRTAISGSLVIKSRANKSGRVMTNRTIIRCRKMTRWLNSCSRYRTIVTWCTVINDTGVIEYCCFKCARYMTHTTILSGCNMSCMLFGCRTRLTITMTGRATIHHTRVIKYTISKVIANTMTYTAICCCSWMRRSRILCFTHCISRSEIITIVAWFTVTWDTCMSEKLWSKFRVCMARMAILVCWNVRGCFN